MQVLIMAGGTGGHVYPALAVARELKNHGDSVSWIGTHQGLEAKVVPEHNIEINWITITGLRQKGFFGWLAAPASLVRAIFQSIRILRYKKPDAVLGMGGFVSGPGAIAARLLGVPLVIHEQNAISGLTNKILARFANRVLEAFPGTFDAKFKAEAVGNPVRAEIEKIKPKTELGPSLNILVVGGSLGAQAINEIMPKALGKFKQTTLPNIWHQTGNDKFATTTQDYARLNIKLSQTLNDDLKGAVYLTEYIDDMADAYSWADVLICRAGAMTVFELAASKRAALFIPYPFAVDDHQTANAEYLVSTGGGMLIRQDELDADELYELINSWQRDKAGLLTMAQAAGKKYIADSAALIRSACREVCT